MPGKRLIVTQEDFDRAVDLINDLYDYITKDEYPLQAYMIESFRDSCDEHPDQPIEKADWNDGYYFEASDRCHSILIMIDELLMWHPAVLRVDGVSDKIKQASRLISEANQDICQYEHEREGEQ